MTPFVYNINVPNVNEALQRGLSILTQTGERESSRNGPVAVMPGPVITIYHRPDQRVLFNTVRNANPFFHLFEALWMLAGRNDLPWLAQFNKQMATYSDDGGQTQPAAYGHRWRNYFGYDQLETIVAILASDPESRRAVLSMWDGGGDRDNSVLVGVGDLAKVCQGSADVPCNTHCYFRVNKGRLDMMVSCRSNDILWGAYGANAVHFSVLLEYIAARLGLAVGTMYQVSFNFHVYLEVLGSSEQAVAMMREDCDLYATKKLRPMPMFADPVAFVAELPVWMDWAAPDNGEGCLTGPPAISDPFLLNVAGPMRAVWAAHKKKDYADAEALCGRIHAEDWRYAAKQWIAVREAAYREKQA